jgi:hypothetical protein
MKLTGKCKEDFEKWLKLKPKRYGYDPVFNWLQTEMQYGVYVDFFYSVGITVWVAPNGDWIYYIEEHDTETEYSERFYLQEQARTAAIEKANEIYNSKG